MTILRSTGRRDAPRAGYSLIEVVISMAVISVMLVAALQSVSVARLGTQQLGEYSRGLLLAEDLMTEILQQEYCDLDYGVDSFGLGPTEDTGDRSQFDDVDDYDGWLASPPQYKDGTNIPWAANYRRSVVVDWVASTATDTVVAYSTGVKRITVVVSYGDREVARLTAVRSISWPKVRFALVKPVSPTNVEAAEAAAKVN